VIYSLSPGLLDVFPALDELLAEIKRIACKLDRDIRTRDLRVEARRNTQPDFYKGWAYPVTRLRDGNGTTYHGDGLVRLHVGANCDEADVVRLYAHELRHIGQFHRGRKAYGTMTISPLSQQASERDAERFEARVLKRIG
jgi:hypothetical protein